MSNQNDTITRLKSENAELKRQLERQALHNEAVNATLLQQQYDVIIERLQTERDELKAIIEWHLSESIQRRNNAALDLQDYIKRVHGGLDGRAIPMIVYYLLDNAIEVNNAAVAVRQGFAPVLDAAPHTKMLYEAQDNAVLTGVYWFGLSSALDALRRADDPRYVAWEIIYECQSTGAPKMSTLQRLPLAWIQEHLKGNKSQPTPRRHYTLYTALKDVQTLRNGERVDSSEKRLQICRRWYETLEGYAREMPKALEIIPQPR